MNDADRQELHEHRISALRAWMERISERCHCSGWQIGLEQAMFKRVFENGPLSYGLGEVSVFEAVEMRRLAEETDSWWHWPREIGVSGPQQITLVEARRLYGAK